MKRRATRAIITAALAATLLGASACGFDAQTLQPYTQAEGVNADSQTDPETDAVLVKVRNLLIVSNDRGSGFLEGALFAHVDDELTDVQVVGVAPDGGDGEELEVSFPGSIQISEGGMAQLNGEQPITVSGDNVWAGRTVRVTLTFANAGTVTVTTPVVDGNKPDYSTITPAPSSAETPQN